MKNTRIAIGAALVMALAAAGCSSNASSPADVSQGGDCSPPDGAKVTVGVNPGSQDLVASTMVDQGFAEDHGIALDIKSFQNPPAAATAVTQKSVDVGFGGNTTMTIARSQGSDVFFFGPFITTPKDGVFVREDSSYQTLGDLDGQKIGSFSGANSATTAILTAIASKSYDVPHLPDSSEIVVAPGPALLGLLDKGEVEGALLVDTGSVSADLSGKYRKVLDLNSGYQEAFGANPMFVGLVTTESYAAGHCGEVTAFAAAYREAVEYLRSNDEAWQAYAESLEFTQDGAAEALQGLSTEMQTEWDAGQVDEATALLESLIPILGTEDFVSELPDGLFDTTYWAEEE